MPHAAGFPPVPHRAHPQCAADGRTVRKAEIDRANLPLKFDFGNTELIGVKLSVAQKAVPDVEEWLGVDNIRVEGNEIFARRPCPRARCSSPNF